MVVKRSDTEVSQLFPASIQGRQDIEIRPQVQGKIVSVNVSEGPVSYTHLDVYKRQP